ncbi:MAG: Do family serine endopeptidase [Gammaproteobacteria bacterium]|nr:Do family serine endopeptidase [Pseudomonadales bacterium]MCP5346444.1 Do family serine endopeptidase [Pseudomonadales bacterium]
MTFPKLLPLPNQSDWARVGLLTLLILPGLVSGAAVSLPNFADLVEANAATIVEISAIRMVERPDFPSQQDLEEFLRRRIDPNELPDLEAEPEEPELRPRGSVGSGFILTSDGFVVTNHHVVAGAQEITVHLTDRREFEAQVVGLDEPSDLALLKIDASGLPAVRVGDSDAVRVGDWVLAIGSPFGLEFSAAAGIVSAKGRSIPDGNSRYNYMSFIQSDVAINQGNSGGPLFNLDGEVIGINSQILSSTGTSAGISFSIPSNVALNVVEQLREAGIVQRGLLGVQIKEVTYALAESFDLDRPQGAFVDLVSPGSPAEAAGIQIEDIILSFNGQEIINSTDLPFFVGQNRPGTQSEVLVYRNGRQLALNVTLGSSPLNVTQEEVAEAQPERRNPLGLRVADLNPAYSVSGVQVLEVFDGPAQQAGILEGDVIVALNRQEITSMEQFSAVVESLPAQGYVQVRIVREGVGTTLALDMN